MIFDLQDVPVATEEADKRRTRFTVLVAAVLVAVLGVLVIAGVKWIDRRLGQSATQKRGEKILAAIAWPDGWQRQAVLFSTASPAVAGSSPHWQQYVVTTADNLAGTDQAVRDAVSAAGWQPTQECATDVTQVLCAWRSGGWLLGTRVEAPSTDGKLCPAYNQHCDKFEVNVSLKPATATDDPPILPSSALD